LTPTTTYLFLDTSILITMLGCPNSINLPQEARAVIHVTHLYETINRLVGAVFELYNTGNVDDKCLRALAGTVLSEINPGRKKRLKRYLVRVEAAKLVNRLLVENNIDVYDEEVLDQHLPACTPRRGAPLSRQDQVLLALAIKCHKIVTNENGIIDCCNQLSISNKCIKA